MEVVSWRKVGLMPANLGVKPLKLMDKCSCYLLIGGEGGGVGTLRVEPLLVSLSD